MQPVWSPESGEPAFQQALLEVVADKTGYPVGMLNLDMDLDADLGIDSIKRVEILSALQERLPGAPAVKPEQLGTLQTLRQIVEFMAAEQPAGAARTEESTAATGGQYQQVLLEVVADKTGYPVDMLNLDMDLDADLGIDSIKRVEILSALQERLPEAPAVKPEQLGQLQTLGQIVTYLQQETATPAAGVQGTAPAPTPMPVTEAAPPQTPVYRSLIHPSPVSPDGRPPIELPAGARVLITDDDSGLPARLCELLNGEKLSAEVLAPDAALTGDVNGLIIMVPQRVDDRFIQTAFSLIQQAGRQGVRLLAGVTRLGGKFGLNDLAAADPEAAAVHGIIKTADKEWAGVNCKCIDIPVANDNPQLAETLAAELLTAGPLELGIGVTERCTLTLQTAPAGDLPDPAGQPLAAGDVVVITGGARGITAEVALALAQTYGVNLLLLGRSPAPQDEPGWLAELTTETDIRQAIISHLSTGQMPSPKAIEKEYKRISANREIRNNLARIRATGVSVSYRSADVRDAGRVAACIDQARREIGPIRGIIHGAGVLADRLLNDKTLEQFNTVFSTKVDGLRSLLQATSRDDLKVMVLFSSSTARFGRKGQADYAAANEVLNKVAQQQQLARPDCRVLSVNWGPWAGGMVTPQLARVFAAEGIGLIAASAGADYLMREIATAGPVEVVILGSDPAALAGTAVTNNIVMQLAFERNVNLQDLPVLQSHVMNGRAVLPAALMVEWMAHGAMHNNPGPAFIGFDDFRILKGVILDHTDNITLQVLAGPVEIAGNRDRILVELRNGEVLHARARIMLSSEYEPPVEAADPVPAGDYPGRDGDYYEDGRLFHGRDLQGIQSVSACSELGITGTVRTAPPPSAWNRNPIRSTWLADPLVLDSCFQLMILWSFRNRGAGSLPTAITGYRQYRRGFTDGDVRIIARVTASGAHNASANIEMRDQQNKLIARLEGYECVIDSSLNDAFRKNRTARITE